MTPKEKAKEIYCKYADALNIRDLQTNANPFAKQCALIAVDEILSALHDASDVDEILLALHDASDDDSPYNHELKYWQEVKQEIENL
jgi:hypothetical protein